MTKTRMLQILVTAFTLAVLALGVVGISASVVASPLEPSNLGQSLVNAITGEKIDDANAMLLSRIALGGAVVVAIIAWIVVGVLLKRARLDLSQIWKPDPREVEEAEAEAKRRAEERGSA